MLLEIPDLPDLVKVSNASTEDLFVAKNKNSMLMNLYDGLVGAIKHYCNVIYTYLKTLDDVYFLLSEYTARVNVNDLDT